MSSKEAVTINLEQDFYEFAKTVADRQGLPLSVYFRTLIHRAILLDVSEYNSWRYFKSQEEEREKF